MTQEHTGLAAGRWQNLTLIEQLANIGSEIERAISWEKKGNSEYSHKAFNRAMELLELSLASKLTAPQFRELTCTQEMLVDYFMDTNIYQTTPRIWQNYFGAFTYAAQLQQGR